MPEKNEYQRVEEACARINKLYQFTGVAPRLLQTLAHITPDDYAKIEVMRSVADLSEKVASDYEEWWKKEDASKALDEYDQVRQRYFFDCSDRNSWLKMEINPETGLPLTLEEKRKILLDAHSLVGKPWAKRKITNEEYDQLLEQMGFWRGDEARQLVGAAMALNKFPPLLTKGGDRYDLIEQAVIMGNEYRAHG